MTSDICTTMELKCLCIGLGFIFSEGATIKKGKFYRHLTATHNRSGLTIENNKIFTREYISELDAYRQNKAFLDEILKECKRIISTSPPF